MSRARLLSLRAGLALALGVAIVCACQRPVDASTAAPRGDGLLEREPWPDPPPRPQEPPRPTAPSLPDGAVGLVVVNPGERELELYAVEIVDVDGRLGARALWPNRRDCKGSGYLPHVVPAREGRFTFPPPARTYGRGSCEPGPPLPDGEYVVRVDSGYAGLYAVGTISLPMRAPVELRVERHKEAIACTDVVARRAVNLAIRGASMGARDPIPPALLAGCDLDQVRCAASGEEPRLPPERCEVTLVTAEHGAQLRVSRPAGRDSLRGLTVGLDRDVIVAQRPHIDRTSSSVFEVAGQRVVIAGVSDSLWHVHGGEGATIDGVVLQVDNPLDRPVAFKVVGIEFLVDFGCALPAKVTARPALRESAPRSQLPPGESALKLGFARQEAYQVHCDRFATRVTLEVEGVTRAVAVEHRVGRFDVAD